MLVLGSAHAPELDVARVLAASYRAADADFALQVGSLGQYDLPTPTYFAAGDRDDLDVVDALRLGRVQSASVSNVHLLASQAVELDGIRVGGLSGTYSETHYRRPRARLYQEHRRHFTEKEVERATQLDVDVFLVHEPPVGVFVSDQRERTNGSSRAKRRDGVLPSGARQGSGDEQRESPGVFESERSERSNGSSERDREPRSEESDSDATTDESPVGCRKINEILGAIQPSLCLIGGLGHHAEAQVGETTLISLAPAYEQFYTLDVEKCGLTRHETPDE